MWAVDNKQVDETMALNVSGFNFQTTTASSGIVSGSELEQVSSEIFSSASKATTAAKTQVNFTTPASTRTIDPGVNFFSKTTDIATANQAAIAKTQDVTVSQTTLSNIQALKTAAAKSQTSSVIHRNVDGKLHMDTKSDLTANFKSAYQLGAINSTENIFKSGSLDKDKRGSSAFSFSRQQREATTAQETEETQKIKELNIFA